MRDDDPYHEGEKSIQTLAGEEAIAARNGRMLNTTLMPGALKFVARQPMAVLGSIDRDANIWASIVVGEPGFVTAPDQHTVLLNLCDAGSHPDDPLWTNIVHDTRVGMLLIELSSRRRLRVNGHIERMSRDNLRLDVDEAYPNCPKYIQRRNLRMGAADVGSTGARRLREGQVLLDDHHELIRSADTFFVASAHAQRGVDASHRGGIPGFVRVLDGQTLRVPDYVGNSMFNTLGNFEANPHAGLAFIDFNARRILQMTGRPTIRWDLPEQPDQPTGGTRRYWDFTVTRWVDADLPRLGDSEFLDYWDGHPQPSGTSPADTAGDSQQQETTS